MRLFSNKIMTPNRGNLLRSRSRDKTRNNNNRRDKSKSTKRIVLPLNKAEAQEVKRRIIVKNRIKKKKFF